MASTGGTKQDEVQEALQALYERVLEGDPIAPAQLAELIWTTYATRGSLINAMRDKGWLSHEEAKDDVLGVVGEFVAKFIASLLEGTCTYDPAKQPLKTYIQMALMGDVLNEAEKARRYRQRHKLAPDDDSVGEGVYPWNLPQEHEQEDDRMQLTDEQRELFQRFRDALDTTDGQFVDLMLDGVRATEPYAELLGLTHVPIQEQRKTVNKTKDRLTKRMKRLFR